MAADERRVLLGPDGRPLTPTERRWHPQRERLLAAVGDLAKFLALVALVLNIVKTLTSH